MTQRIENRPEVVRMRSAMSELGFPVEVAPSIREVAFQAVNGGSRPRFVLKLSPGSKLSVADADREARLAVVWIGEPSLGAHAWLAGQDEAQLFAQPLQLGGPAEPALRTVAGAIERITPPEVRQARAAGLRVVRQGDIWFVPVQGGTAGALLDTRHEAENLVEIGRGAIAWGWVTHPQHAPVWLDGVHLVYRNLAGD